MIRKIFSLSLILLTTLTISAKTKYYRLIAKKDPAHAYTIGWIQLSGQNVMLKYDTQENFSKTGMLKNTVKKIRFINYKGLKNAFCTLSGLQPDTKYVIQIIDSDSKSRLMWFHTLPVGNNIRLSIIAGGDSRSRPQIRQMANRMVAKLQPDLVIFDGDFTAASTEKQWLQWFDDWQLTISNGHLIPIVVIPGNHERKQDVCKFFDLLSHPHGFYSFNISGNFIHFVSLNTQYTIPGQQTDWFKQDLKSHQDVLWTIVAYHKPMRPHYSHKRIGVEQYKYWAPIIYKYRVPLVIEGDTHTDKITYPIRPDSNGDQGFVRDNSTGTVYVGEGCWGAPLRPANDIKSWTRDAASIDQFKWIWISPKEIQIRTIEYHSVDTTQALTYKNRFTVPYGIKFHKTFDGKEVVIVKRR